MKDFKEKLLIDKELISTIKSMSAYWEEIKSRHNCDEIANHELMQLFHYITPINILLIVSDYIKTIDKENKGEA